MSVKTVLPLRLCRISFTSVGIGCCSLTIALFAFLISTHKRSITLQLAPESTVIDTLGTPPILTKTIGCFSSMAVNAYSFLSSEKSLKFIWLTVPSRPFGLLGHFFLGHLSLLCLIPFSKMAYLMALKAFLIPIRTPLIILHMTRVV